WIELVASDPAMDLDPRDAGLASDGADVPRVLPQERLDLGLAIGGGSARQHGLDGRLRVRLANRLRQVREPDRTLEHERERDLQRALELADVEGPVVADQRAAGFERERRRRGVGLAEDGGDQQAEIRATLAQRRKPDHEVRDPGVEIPAKP